MTRSSSRLALSLLVAGLAFAPVAARQAPGTAAPANVAPAVTFRTEVNYVEVDATAVTKDGRFVGDLRREDFEVLEDGQPQDVTAFSVVNIPIERPEQPLYAAHPIQADVVSNARPFDGRLYVLVLDDL